MTQKKLEKLYLKIMCELFANAEPKADFMEFLESKKGDKTDWYMNYYLPRDKFEKIYNRNIKGKRWAGGRCYSFV